MKAMNTIIKILTALAAVAGVVYIVATYGEQIVAWCKKMLASMPKCPCCEQDEAAEEVAEEAPAEEVVEEVEAEVTNVEMEEPKLEETPSVAPKKKGNSTLWIVLLVLLLLIAFGLYWIFRSPSQEETQPTPVKVESIVEETPAIVEEPDSSSTLTIEEPALAISASNEKVATIADTTEYKIVGNKTSYTVQSGETLTKIALKFYGSKNYWPYIAIHNKGTLKNTNQLSVGVKLEIPELKPINE